MEVGKMADICGNLWEYNLARVVVIDVSDDYRLMQPPMPSECYPVLKEVWLPTYQVVQNVTKGALVDGYLYDWHESPIEAFGTWYVGMVHSALLAKSEMSG
jgi:hypothetical protein